MAEPDTRCIASRCFRSHSTDATEAFGAAVARAIEAQHELARTGVVLTLEGDLGSGKTTFVRGLAAGLGASDRAHSPSFTLMHTYQGRLPIYHFDAWMEGRERAFLDSGGAEWLDHGGLAVIEWASRVEAWLPSARLGLLLEHMGAHDPESRRLTLSAFVGRTSASEDARARALAAVVGGFHLADDQASAETLEEA